MDEFAQIFVQFQDHLAPKLDVYEQAIYLYVFRQTVLESRQETVIGFKSARKKLAFGVGTAGTPPSEDTVYKRLRSLESKGCIEILSSENSGTRLRIVLPNDIPGLIPSTREPQISDLQDLDFFSVPANRKLILEREAWACFYCLARLDENNHVIEHVLSRPEGDSSFKNVVAACRRCNNRKSGMEASDFLRLLYREGILSGDEFAVRLSLLEQLQRGELRPPLSTRTGSMRQEA